MSTPAIGIVHTKIVATIGPACRGEESLASLVQAGVDVFRLNMAHGSIEEHQETLDRVRRVSDAAARPVGVLVDLGGPKIRLGELPGGLAECVEGAEVCFVRDRPAAMNEFTTTYAPLVDELAAGDSVMLADGTVSLVVEERLADRVRCRVVQGGAVRSRQGVNLPGVKLSVVSMSADDWRHAEWAAQAGADFVSLSFVRSPVEVRLLKELLRTRGSRARVVAKIEKREALDDLAAIVEAADVVMVARGDLGVEIDVAGMPMVQKQIIRMCQRYQKPVIVATQMLDSMQHSRRPTRAEATDVANAILDGADACMLSGETAIGDHPRLVVEMMRRIAGATERQYIADRREFISEQAGRSRTGVGLTAGEFMPAPEYLVEGLHPITQAVVDGAGRIAAELDARLVVVASKSGVTAIARSKRRGSVPTVGVSDAPATLRQMALYWGVTPLAVECTDTNQLLEHICEWGLRSGRLQRGDRILLVAGTGFGAGGHNMALVHEV
ncbi:MAG: pyruvate kinase [Planctomycetota bacterium]|jgi:pyruvate kinase|nr:MAG: pyruvate kinase [Planctomycetota bacterium]